ncbi:MAG: hypothetical protein HY917_02495 [Candidatus Diapherotrites archaeon]|nr:hypothetical protein [Candidatus Diapherotrites archaeon]
MFDPLTAVSSNNPLSGEDIMLWVFGDYYPNKTYPYRVINEEPHVLQEGVLETDSQGHFELPVGWPEGSIGSFQYGIENKNYGMELFSDDNKWVLVNSFTLNHLDGKPSWNKQVFFKDQDDSLVEPVYDIQEVYAAHSEIKFGLKGKTSIDPETEYIFYLDTNEENQSYYTNGIGADYKLVFQNNEAKLFVFLNGNWVQIISPDVMGAKNEDTLELFVTKYSLDSPTKIRFFVESSKDGVQKDSTPVLELSLEDLIQITPAKQSLLEGETVYLSGKGFSSNSALNLNFIDSNAVSVWRGSVQADEYGEFSFKPTWSIHDLNYNGKVEVYWNDLLLTYFNASKETLNPESDQNHFDSHVFADGFSEKLIDLNADKNTETVYLALPKNAVATDLNLALNAENGDAYTCFQEDFSTTNYKDSNSTTAYWNTDNNQAEIAYLDTSVFGDTLDGFSIGKLCTNACSDYYSQAFTPTENITVNGVSVGVRYIKDNPSNLYVQIRTDNGSFPSNTVLAEGSLDITSPGEKIFSLPETSLAAGQTYHLVLLTERQRNGSEDSSLNYYIINLYSGKTRFPFGKSRGYDSGLGGWLSASTRSAQLKVLQTGYGGEARSLNISPASPQTITQELLTSSDLVPTGTSIDYFIGTGNADNITWEPITKGTEITLSTQGNSLSWKARLNAPTIDAKPLIYDLNLCYYTQNNSTPIEIDVGANGTNEWNQNLTPATNTTVSNLKEAVNEYLSFNPDENGLTEIPISISSNSTTKTRVFNVNTEYNVTFNKPSLIQITNPNNFEAITGTRLIEWTATDPENDDLNYSIYLTPTNKTQFELIQEGIQANTHELDSRTVPDGEYLLTIQAKDPENTSTDYRFIKMTSSAT